MSNARRFNARAYTFGWMRYQTFSPTALGVDPMRVNLHCLFTVTATGNPSLSLCRLRANRILTLASSLLIALSAPGASFSQTPAPLTAPASPQAAPAAATVPSAPVFKTEELDQIVAPIALYPDDLLAQVLMASSYPVEIVQAQRWAADPKNTNLKGDQLAAALQDQPWDPSVKSLVPFPQVLKMMSDELGWTQKLGDAVLAQQKDLMDAVQRLRQRAQANGSLQSTKQQTVSTEQQTIVIQPADPQVIYVPAYNPNEVYGTWPYPSYPPVYYPPPHGYYAGAALVSGMAFAAGVAVTGSLWGWGHFNWGGNSININNNVYNNINRTNINAGRATNISGNSWRHDPAHRGGVAYRDPGTRSQFRNASAANAASRQNFRGFDNNARSGAQAGNRLGAGGARTAGGAPSGRSMAQARATPGAFGGIGSGADVRAQSARGMASRGATTQTRAAAAGGGFRGGGGGGGPRGGGGGLHRR